jgi:hypothetical protein
MDLIIIFAIGWVASHAFGEKRDEYSASQDAHREKYLAKLKNNHPSWGRARQERYLHNAARRNALGHFAYLLRHGWSSTFNDFGDGWKKAKAAHEEWKSGNPKDGKKLSRWATFKAGWKDSLDRRPKATGYYEARPDLTPEAPEPTWTAVDVKPDRDREHDERMLAAKEEAHRLMLESFPKVRDDLTEDELAEHLRNRRRLEGDIANLRQTLGKPAADPWLDDDQARDAKILPWTGTSAPGDTAGSTNGSTAVASTEFNFDASKGIISHIGQTTGGFASQLEQVEADAIAGGLGSDTAAMSILSNLQETLRNARALADAYVDNANKHQSGQEYANSGHAASTDYLRSS